MIWTKEFWAVSLAAAWLTSGLALAFGSETCPQLERMNPETQLEYLQRDRSALTENCTAYAIELVGRRRSPQVTTTLIRFLDFARPADPARAHLPVNFRIPTLGSIFPATDALFEIGKPAIPDLVKAIAMHSTSDTARNNAIQVIFQIYREDVAEAVRVLNRAAKTSTEWEASQRLFDAAQKTAAMCKEPMRNLCMNALQ